MRNDNIVGITWLLANANSESSFQGKRYCFKGDLGQMAEAQRIAASLGIRTGIQGGIPFATSKEDFKLVTKYLIDLRVDGWWHYVTDEEYRQLKSQTSFEEMP